MPRPTLLPGCDFYLDGGTLYMGNRDIQFSRTLYGLNNTCYITNDGANFTTAGSFAVGGSGTLSMGGITLTLNAYGTNPYSIIANAGGDMYIRSASGNVRMDSGPLVVYTIQCPNWMWVPTIYFNTSQAAPTFNKRVRRSATTQPASTRSRAAGQVNATIVQITSSLNCNGAVWRCDGVQCISTLPPSGSQHWFMTNGQATWAPVYAGSFTPQSARKSKDNIRVLEDPLRFVLDDTLHGVRYTERSTGDEKVGFIADDWRERRQRW